MNHRIPRPVHGLLDYAVGTFLAASPWLFHFSQEEVASRVALTVGLGTILYSLFTSYELGIVHLLPFRFHLFFDLIAGFLLATNWLHFAFKGRVGVLFTAIGLLEIVVVIFSRRDGPVKMPDAT